MDLSATGSRWAIATPHTTATRAGADAFEAGGNALDAALAAATTLAVVYPQMCGVGGDLFALVARAEQPEIVAINSSGAAPAAIDPDRVRSEFGTMPQRGPFTITVPGAVAGWRALCDQGARFDWERHFATAIACAHDGVPVSPGLAESLAWSPELAADPGIGQVFFPGGGPLREGDLLRQPALAATLEAIASAGPGAMYGGEVGRRYAEGLRAAGSPIALEDLAAHRADLVPPLVGRYRDLDVRVVPPNSQGFVLLEILAAIERLGIDPDPLGPDAAAIGLAVAAARADRDRHLADPRAMRVHAGTLLDDGHLAALTDAVREAHTAIRPPSPHAPHHGDTIGLVTADADGNAVSLIQSLYDGLGSGILEPSTGIVGHSRGAQFVLDPEHPNVLAPRKRPAHTLMPALAHRGDRPAFVLGTMGGHGQPQINATNLIRLADLGQGAAEALAGPRWLVGGLDEGDDRVVAEHDVPQRVLEDLKAAGFEVETVPGPSGEVGHAHAIRVRPDGTFEVGSDPRADGGAMAS
jgi:gamma-glutamyltranspeptidase/glutathione hydrolase